MAQVRWSEHSLRDLEAIYYFVARDSTVNAASVIMRIRRSVERLRDFPRSGRIVPEVGREDIREVLVGAYRVVYYLRDDDIEVVTVQHGSRLLPPEDVPQG